MSTINNCVCPIAPIVRYINFQVIDGNKNLFLNKFKDQIDQPNILAKLNACLTRHGFNGTVQPFNDTYFYCES